MAITGWCTGCRVDTNDCTAPDLHRAKGLHRWKTDFRLGGYLGKRMVKIHKAGISKKDAEKFEHITVADYERGKFLPKTRKALSFVDLADKYYNEHSLQNTRNPAVHTKYRIAKWKELLSNRIARDIKRQELKDIRAKLLAQGLSAATVNRLFNDLKAIFYKGMEWELIDSNPCEFITKLEEDEPIPQFATQDEINRMRQAARAFHPRLLDFMTVLLHTGARPSSIAACRWESGDVDFNARTIWFTTYKGRRKYRYPHPIDDVLYELLVRRAAVTGKKGPVFDCSNVGQLGTRAIKASGINKGRPEKLKFTLYGLKHCYASQLLMSGATMDEVRRLLGHTDDKMLRKHYGHLTQEYLARIQKKVNLTPQLEPEQEKHI